MFQELYYEHYRETCSERYWEEEKILPYSVLIYEQEKREELEKLLLDNGFRCVVYENGYPLMFVNLPLKRFGRNVKACGSSAINKTPMSYEDFKEKILYPYLENEGEKETKSMGAIKYMSYLEAHKIVFDYVDVVAKHDQRKNAFFLRKSDYINTKEEIICAFKLFFAVGYRYGGNLYTTEEWESYKMLFSELATPWMEDSFVDEFVKCERILNDKSLWGRIKNRSAIPYVRYKKEKLIEEWGECLTENDSEEFLRQKNAFLKEVNELAQASAKRKREFPDDEENAIRYFQDVYRIIGLTPRTMDFALFWPIPTLQKFAKTNEMGKYFTEEQKLYVFQHMK